MALPTLVKTYEVTPNYPGSTSGTGYTVNRQTLFNIKEILVGNVGNISTAAMTVLSSSDGAGNVAGAGGNWADISDVLWAIAGTNHSWIVLKANGLATIPYEILLDCSFANSTSHYLKMYVSPAGGFTGGTATAAPTAPDQIAIMSGSTPRWCSGDSGLGFVRTHALMSTDGDQMMVIVTSRQYTDSVQRTYLIWRFDVVQDPVSGWADGLHMWVQGSDHPGTDIGVFTEIAGLNVTNQHRMIVEEAGTVYNTQLSYEGVGIPTTTKTFMKNYPRASEWDGGFPFGPIGVWSYTAPMRGRVGTLTDIWWGAEYSGRSGATYPDTGTLHQFAQIGDIIIPWDGANPVLLA